MIKDFITKNEETIPNVREITALREYFPSCFKDDGSFDIERFKEFLSDKVDLTHEGYELRFLGKKYARLLATLETTTVIVPDGEHNSLPENQSSENIYISGDNLDGLKHLLKSYAGEVKCVYIDPPYNTGSDGFVYNDSFNFTAEGLAAKLSVDEEQAQRILDLTKRGSASHSAWLMFMYPRLLLARDLLSDDGVIFISVDDNEQGNLRLLCDNVFGEENFIAQIVVQSNKRGQTYKQLAKTHEYILVYTRNVNVAINELMKDISSFTKVDGISEFSERELRNRNSKFGRFNRPNLYYPIFVNPNIIDDNGYSPVSLEKEGGFSIEVYPTNSEGLESCWRWGAKKFSANSDDDPSKSNVVGRMKATGEYGVYEKYRKTTYKAKTIWFLENLVDDLPDEDDAIWDETGVITEQGSAELAEYGMGNVFDFPKPTYLIKKILILGANNNSICVDFFSGSATTADAVMQLNAEPNGSNWTLRHISIQLPENLDVKFSKAGASDKPKIQNTINFLDSLNKPHTLDQIGIERIIRAAKSIREGNAETTADLGFRHYTLVEPPQDTLDKLEKFNPDHTASNMLAEFGKQTVLTTWLVRDGYGFTAQVREANFAGYEAHHIGKHLYLVDEGLTDAAIMAIVERFETDSAFKPENVVLFGYSFTWTERETLQINLKRLKGKEGGRSVNFDVRY